MKLTRIKIENYRSIKSLEFRPKKLCAIVGENNVGKSNIFSALNFILGPTFPTEKGLGNDDFYLRDPKKKIKIEVDLEIFESASPENITLSFSWDDTAKGGPRYSLRKFSNSHPSYINDEERQEYALVHLGADRKISEYMPSNRWTLLGRLLLDINEEFKSDPSRVVNFEAEMKKIRDELLFNVEGFRELVKIVKDESARQLSKSPDDFEVDFQLYDPWHFYRTLQIIVKEAIKKGEDKMSFQASQMGMGLQSSLTIALLRAYAKIKKSDTAVIAIEEPEIFLHPQAQRHFYNLLRKIAYPSHDEGIQIIYCTHSPLFVDVEYFDEVCLVRKDFDEKGEATTTVTQLNVQSFIEDLKARKDKDATEESIRERFRNAFTPRRNEGFFAKKVVLVEGETEEYALSIYADALGYNFDSNGISVISVGGKNELDRLFRIFNEFAIPSYIIFDGDKGKDPDEKSKEQTQQLLKMFNEPDNGPDNYYPATNVKDRYAVFEVDFETTLKKEQPLYARFETDAKRELGLKDDEGKGMRARLAAIKLINKGQAENDRSKYIPPTIKKIVEKIKSLSWYGSVLKKVEETAEEDIPF
ncbi:MAG TPA: AAA family ATPase [Defluviitoga tunisiensis]|nr:AAA family ATPase [Defluviitoga tunisiensis]